MTDKYDRGPKPASPLPWWSSANDDDDDGTMRRIVLCRSTGLLSHASGILAPDAAAIVHRVNSWDAACDEIDRLRALLAELPGLVRDECGCEGGEAEFCPYHVAAAVIEARIREVGCTTTETNGRG